MSRPVKPLVGVETFQGLDLRVGTVIAHRLHPELPDLGVIEVSLGSPVEALAPSSVLPADLSGRRVVVAVGLHPLHVGDRSYAAALVTDDGDGTAVLIDADIPDNARLV